jgi:hypothetical protein
MEGSWLSSRVGANDCQPVRVKQLGVIKYNLLFCGLGTGDWRLETGDWRLGKDSGVPNA